MEGSGTSDSELLALDHLPQVYFLSRTGFNQLTFFSFNPNFEFENKIVIQIDSVMKT